MTYTARHLLFAALLGLLLGALAVHAVHAASRAPFVIPVESWKEVVTAKPTYNTGDPINVTFPAAAPTQPAASASVPGLILDPAPPATAASRPAVAPTAPIVVLKPTARPKVTAGSGTFHVSIASWYGPGFYGQRTACGQTLTEGLIGVAHKTLPCGTPVTFRVGSRVLTAPVVDRGPYIAGREWDLTAGLCAALRVCSTGPIEWRL